MKLFTRILLFICLLAPVSLTTMTSCEDDGITATCSDGIQNGDETGVDCGGTCASACATCTTCTSPIIGGSTITFCDTAYTTTAQWQAAIDNVANVGWTCN